MLKRLTGMAATLAMATCFAGSALAEDDRSPKASENAAVFDWFEYSGDDSIFEAPIGEGQYQNPVLAGFYPDPSIVRVGQDFYMTNSTFGYFPGLPVWHSRDLVNWRKIGNAISRHDQMPYAGVHLGRGGLYAATIEYHNGRFLIVNTCVACGGNFVVTATDPAGPWSDPIWVPQVGGIDPQIYFEGDRAWMVNHNGPEGEKLYNGHSAIWIREIDPDTFQPVGPRKMLVDGGVDITQEPGYVEGPHIFKRGDWYYLSAAEGGTGGQHRQVVWRSRDVMGPYASHPNNPVLTQRFLARDRPNPVNAAGHADMVDDGNGNWWAVFLATRTYNGYLFNTGRETWLLPIEWRDGWPWILDHDEAVPYLADRPALADDGPLDRPVTGNFTIRDEFQGSELDNDWLFARAPQTPWWDLVDGRLEVTPRADRLGSSGQPSFIGRRLQHTRMSAVTRMTFAPDDAGDEAGLMVAQHDESYYALGLSQADERDSKTLTLRRKTRDSQAAHGEIIASEALWLEDGDPIYLKVDVDGPTAAFSYSLDGESFETIADGLDASILASPKAGGFVGALAGVYAETGPAVIQQMGAPPPPVPAGIIARGIYSRAFGKDISQQFVDSQGVPGGRAFRLTMSVEGPNPYAASAIGGAPDGDLRAGDRLTLRFWARVVEGAGRIRAVVQRNQQPYDGAIGEDITLGPEWRQFEVSGVPASDIGAGKTSIGIQFGGARQVIELGPYELEKHNKE